MDGKLTGAFELETCPNISRHYSFWLILTSSVLVLGLTFDCLASSLQMTDDSPLQLPPVGAYQLRVIAPTILELTLITAKPSGLGRGDLWDFIDRNGRCRLPGVGQFAVFSQGGSNSVKAVGFKRRVLYAPIKQRDLRVANYLYLQLANPVGDNATVEVTNPDRKIWPSSLQFKIKAEQKRWSPAVHVNQTGYLPAYSKKAMVGYYLGSLGELDIEALAGNSGDKDKHLPQVTSAAEPATTSNPGSSSAALFQLLDATSCRVAFENKLTLRPDRGFPFSCYQKVFEADFSSFKTPGQYLLFVPGLGCSFPFFIQEGVAGAFARTYAQGIYHQRCGTDNSLPFTRFTHGPCHTAPAEVPNMTQKFASVNTSLAKETENFKDNPRHTAPQLKNVSASLYPFVNPGPVDVRGGHHDAGDYSKYTINSAAFVHHLIFAADAFPGVATLDNLGLPESGDGKSDVLQEAKWEADFLAKMQDADGGFYFLVYPRDREYEDNVTPDHGDPQIVFPKNTSATAAAVAALAQCASSPAFKKQFPDSAAQYLAKAKKGWAFLQRAIEKFGKDGAYQKITHYGDEFMHDDELAWAACEMFLATGDKDCHKQLLDWLKPADPETRRWGWWRLFDSYGNAIRSYAFAAKTGRVKRDELNPLLLADCENEIDAAGQDQLRRSQQNAYGTSFPLETKKVLAAGWYFSSDAAFDLAVAYQLDYPIKRDPRPKLLEAMLANLNYEQGCNPVNVTFLTGLGWKRQREIVHQYAQNDRRILPPSGIPLGNIQAGFGWNYRYDAELDKLSFPPDGSQESPYPFYDRWGDGFNLSQEFVIVNQARALGYLAWLMAQTTLKDQPWKPLAAQIKNLQNKAASTNSLHVELSAPGLDLSTARIVWEADGQALSLGAAPDFDSSRAQAKWVEAEAQLPDGRRVFGVSDATAKP